MSLIRDEDDPRWPALVIAVVALGLIALICTARC